MILRFRGLDARGGSRCGATDKGSAADLAERLFGERWRWAEITEEGVEVGGVSRSYSGPRTWWGEKAKVSH
jgi:hypothetical protein